ncbi:hypothetical protein TW95_gp0617 [Pandoravirus inopinatum]|uniref:Ankyrin repeat protein n=1 Tax=Pandoravirus inopinatum TaxID=1605721 RepID=A0A0B5J950_9VIRU|nr:hypothetical protein TW95_gp0617 [Pandoravirus inopinatum]AJF97351.1 hypothetical protein [Pandoravirus inopinatum]
MIEAAARGHLDVLKTLHKTVAQQTRHGSSRCQCPREIGIAAVQADRPDIVDWLLDQNCAGAPPLDPHAIAMAVTKAHRPRFIAWAAARGHTADPTCLDDLAQRNVVRALALMHETGLCACTAQAVRAAARAAASPCSNGPPATIRLRRGPARRGVRPTSLCWPLPIAAWV